MRTQAVSARRQLTTVERWRVMMWLWMAMAAVSLVVANYGVALHMITVAMVFNVGSMILERLDSTA